MKTPLQILCLFTFMCFCAQTFSQEISIIPEPAEFKKSSGSFTIANATPISVPGKQAELQKIARFFAAKVVVSTGFDLRSVDTENSGIQLLLNDKPDTKLGQEG